MSDKKPTCVTCQSSGICGGKGLLTLKEGAWTNNPLAIQILGICSALAVTNKLENSLVMGGALIFVCVCSNLFVSLLRNVTPHRIRMIAEVAIIATFVILFDQFLKAFYWEMSKQLGPYVGLIITNCIIMGRAEAFALQNPPVLSMIDGAANGLGYAAVLAIIGFFRELLGSGEILGYTVLSGRWYTANQLMILAPGAFFTMGIVIAIFNVLKGPDTEEKK
jgi:Na+-transporting NADH:ubiquinone oxidoreductase subunit D